MSKRLSNSQSNTLFNYFKSPKGLDKTKKEVLKDEPEEPMCEKDDEPEPYEGSDDEYELPKKKRRRMLSSSESSDSSDAENTTPPSQRKKTSKQKTTKNIDVKRFSFQTANTSENGNTTPKKEVKKESFMPAPAEEKTTRWLHEKLEFLKPDKIRDGDRRKSNDPNYDPRTLYVPLEYLNSLTPAMRQWWELKSKHNDSVLFFKVGKFYELYHMDATIGVEYLGFSYMKGEFAHSGFPETAYGKMAESLIDQGFKVARVEQTETPDMMAERCKGRKASKFEKVVAREICQITSKGTLTYGAQLTDAKQPLACYMIAIAEKVQGYNRRFGISFIDTSIGTFYLSEFEDDIHCSRLLTLFSQHPPALVITEKNRLSTDTNEVLKKSLQNIHRDTLIPDTQFYSVEKVLSLLTTECYFKKVEDGEAKLPNFFSKILTDGSCKEEYMLALRAFGACMWYLKDSFLDIQLISMAKFEFYDPIDVTPKADAKPRDHMILDSVTMNNLKLLGGMGTLQKNLDLCVTAFGKRLLQQWICHPLCDIDRLKSRQEAVTELRDNTQILQETRELLSKLPDIERQIAKIHSFGNKFCTKLHPNGRAILYEGKIYAKRKIFDLLSTLEAFELSMGIPAMFKEFKAEMLQNITQFSPDGQFNDLHDELKFFKEAFDHKKAKEDGVIKPQDGVDKDYDNAHDHIQSIEKELKSYLSEQSRHFKCDVKYFGNDKKRYQLEVPEHRTNLVTHEYSLESTKKGSKPCKRYSTSRTKELLAKMMKAETERGVIVQDLNRRIFEKFSDRYEKWTKTLHCLALLDCLCSLAEYGRIHVETVMPIVHPFKDEPFCKIVNGRHPYIINVDNFVPNDTFLGTENQANILILTGPNMGGKSTLMRQVVLISVMAQIGGFVPAEYCELSLVDRVFTRLGAYDDIFKNQSTFLVELNEACAILKHATKNSIILLDELGRGTSTHDGNAIATAYVKKLTEINCRTIFSTHYHSLVEYFKEDSSIQMGYMTCMVENEGDPNNEQVTFLYKMDTGVCPNSYGFNVAKLAGLLPSVVIRAREIAAKLESATKNHKILVELMSNDVNRIKQIIMFLK